MKMIVCILQDSDKDKVTKALNDEGFRVTVMPSTGGYFRKGNTTLLIGADDDQVAKGIQIIKQNCKEPDEPGLKRATVFVLNVDRHEQI
jgi:uncharacterized protein YaaQ